MVIIRRFKCRAIKSIRPADREGTFPLGVAPQSVVRFQETDRTDVELAECAAAVVEQNTQATLSSSRPSFCLAAKGDGSTGDSPIGVSHA